jgi:cellulose synthase/poly-beta-1,6-N-acetylglucosamine synthase-like glycosyltransferase
MRRRRQIGGDRRTDPNPAVPTRASALALVLGRIAVVVTVGSWAAYVAMVTAGAIASGLSTRGLIETVVYLVVVSFLALSALSYLVTRQGYLRRTRSHVRVPRAELESFFEEARPSVTVLVPAYREQPEVILQTVLSAALQEFAGLRVTLLIDNPPQPSNKTDHDLLMGARAIPERVREMLEAPRVRFAGRLDQQLAQAEDGTDVEPHQLVRVADDYTYAATWLEELADGWVCHDHTDDFFVDHILRSLARDLRVVATALEMAVAQRATMDAARVVQLQRRLVSIFSVEVTSFERKRYASLSAEPNKAMNLNSYIGLLGASYTERETSAGTVLVSVAPDDPAATLHVPDTDYLVTLDADSVLLPEYCLRLVYELEQPEHARAGVFQTPYSSFPGAPTRVERLAGTTTDIQHIVHQGMAEYGAAFWVGANAVLRTEAVRSLEVDDRSEGQSVRRYISDRTVIEDTESTLDLTTQGWTVENYPERLAYSASPPDFGSLCIQRQRWANGGLIILGKLPAHWRAKKARGERRRIIELLLRLNYLASITWATAGLVLLLAYPFDQNLMSLLVVAMSVPYFAIMAMDLRRCGHRSTDVLRIYGFNLIMLPVNASGVARTIAQMITGQKVAFRRTPKVRHRSIAPASFVIFSYFIVAVSAFALVSDLHHDRLAHAMFSGLNVVIAAPAILAIIGAKHSIIDVWFGLVNRLYTMPKRPVAAVVDPVVDWAAVLYHGTLDHPASLPGHRRAAAVPALSKDVL